MYPEPVADRVVVVHGSTGKPKSPSVKKLFSSSRVKLKRYFCVRAQKYKFYGEARIKSEVCYKIIAYSINRTFFRYFVNN
jgi:hypothetical protein